jgi:hypothetical protein
MDPHKIETMLEKAEELYLTSNLTLKSTMVTTALTGWSL